MDDFKFFVVLCVFLASGNGAAVQPLISDIHNIDDCDITATTALLQSNIYEPGKFLQVVSRTISFTESPGQPLLIKCIKVTNLDTSTHGGYPKLVRGGVGSYNAEILLTSQLGQPLNFKVDIWG